ncbi:MAG: hypothetical protein H0X42_04020 [Solirubrobacterales bacterium]|nr:hypothetical protein [Solirubrobacterales bacterium]
MKRLKGPEIKMPKLKAPQFLVDLYRDLDDRHLLPIVALLIIAIVAIPFVLSDSGSSAEEAGAEAIATPSAIPGTGQSKLVVVKEDPRLRTYKHRLDHLHAKDPFGSGSSSSSSSSEDSEPSASTSAQESITEVETSTTEESTPTTESSGSSPSTVESGSTKATATYFTYAIDVRVTPIGGDGKPSKVKPEVREELPPLVMLPSRETPALTYIGPSRDGKKAMMLVSSDVTALFGDSKCAVGSQACQLLALEPGLPETVVYGPKARTYKIELIKTKVVYTDHLERAPLGQPKKSDQVAGRIAPRGD